MQTNQSIEDLLKKSPNAPNKPSATATSISPTARKATQAKAAPPVLAKVSDELTEKMSEIKLRQFEKMAQEEAQKRGMPYIVLRGFPIAPEAISLIPRQTSDEQKVISFLRTADQIRIATTKPTQEVKAIEARLAAENHAQVQTYFVSQDSFDAAFKLYDVLPVQREVIYGYRINEEDLLKFADQIANFTDLQKEITKVSTTDVITLMIGAALKANASDIHIEAEEKEFKIRLRLDGVLYDAARLPSQTWQQFIGRLKLLSGVKINVEGVPQDGRITIYLPTEKVDIRVSFLPTTYGESVVMRLLRPKSVALEFASLGIRGLALERLSREIEKPNGMIVTTGPTGSGKTTTLYAVLNKLNDPGVKIITLEDPIEYKLEGINQSQVEHEKGYDFAKGLRSILRQDPDIVMVGEIRDLETAEIAIQAALTGHLVVTTVHTNSAAATVPRLLSMGVKPFLLAPAISAVIGQRLVRRLCPDCSVDLELSASELHECQRILETIPKSANVVVDLEKLHFKGPGAGCKTCNNFKYKGRVGIYEIFTMNKEIEGVILSKEISEYKIQDLAVADGMITMAQDGLLKALEGITSPQEVLAIANVDANITDANLVEVKE